MCSAVSGETMQRKDKEIWAVKACKADKPPGICLYHTGKIPSRQYGCETSMLSEKELSPSDNYN